MSPSTNQSSNNENQAGPGSLEATISNRAADYPAGFPYAQLYHFVANTDMAPGDLENIFANVLDDFYCTYPEQDSAIASEEQDSIITQDEQDSANRNDDEQDSVTHDNELNSTNPNDDEQDSITHDVDHDELDSVTTEGDELDSIVSNDDELDSTAPQTKELESITPQHSELASFTPQTTELESITPHDSELASFPPRADELDSFTSNHGELDSAIPNGGELASIVSNDHEQDVTSHEPNEVGQASQPANTIEQAQSSRAFQPTNTITEQERRYQVFQRANAAQLEQFPSIDELLHEYTARRAEQDVVSSEQEQGTTSSEHEQYGQAFLQPTEHVDWRAQIEATFGPIEGMRHSSDVNHAFNSNYRLNFDGRSAASPPAATCRMADIYNPVTIPDSPESSPEPPAAAAQPGYQPSTTMSAAGPQAWYQSNQINPADHMSTAAGPPPDWPQVLLPVAASPAMGSGWDESSGGEHDGSSSSSDGDDDDDDDDDNMSGDGLALAVGGHPTHGGKSRTIQYDSRGAVVNRPSTPPPREARSPRTRKEKEEEKRRKREEKKEKKGKKKASASRPATRSSAANPRGDAEDGRSNTQRDDQRYQARRGQAWSAAERAALEDAMRWVLDAHPRATVTERWELASDRMAASSGVFRGPNAVKIQWGRKGRQDSGVDERRKPKPHRMTTSHQEAGARSSAESKAVAASGQAGREADAKKRAEKEEQQQQRRKRRRVVVDEDEDEEEAPPRPLLKRRRAAPVLSQSPPPGDVDMREAAVEDLPAAAGPAGEGAPAPNTQAQEAADAALARLLQQEEVANTRPRRSRRG
ncbi:hypothetical protein GTA08_BOTSDO01053 [Neofusicoccum parvum]|uniref:Uncharacterized protein n=1 Tax=Neofusicoccum parvum TaxID=310453 RepID=A0ACB5S2E0_9PEZI|nr:hypothetical protein GTA08_BOTSDO01053 [Neofusicoccum parvum]